MSFYQCYTDHRFTSSTQRTLDQANDILNSMARRGYVLTLRQLYYQMVASDLLPNQDREYKRLGRIMTRARESGCTDWLAIEDRGRNCYGPSPEEDPANVLRGLEDQIEFDYWARQDHYVEVWVEKQALEGVISRPCNRMKVPYMACKGFLSASEAWRAGLRFAEARRDGKECVLIHLADHDPSGIAMTRDNSERLFTFAEFPVEVRRIALNMEQVEEYDPPPNPAKETDSRFREYQRMYGDESWELDALEPEVLDDLIESAVWEYVDQDKWLQAEDDEFRLKRDCGLAQLADNWDEVRDFMEREGLI